MNRPSPEDFRSLHEPRDEAAPSDDQRREVVDALIERARQRSKLERVKRAVRERPDLALGVLGFWTGLES